MAHGRVDSSDDARGEPRFEPGRRRPPTRAAASEDSTSIAYIGELDSGRDPRLAADHEPGRDPPGLARCRGRATWSAANLFNDDVPTEFQTIGKRTFARLVPSDEKLGNAAAGVVSKAPGTGALIISDGSRSPPS